MNKPISLTPRERDVARRALEKHSNLPWDCHLDRIIAAINHVRDPDPVGTVRHSGNTELAIKREYGWLIVHGDYLEEASYPPHADWWPVIYTPQGDE